MKIASFARDDHIDCGLVHGDHHYKVFDRHPVLSRVRPRERLFHILAMSGKQRRELAHEMADAPAIARDAVGPVAAVPYCPLYIYMHGNNATVWRRQNPSLRWRLAHVPYPRIRPFSAFSGDHGEILVQPGASSTSCGAEFGVVLGREAHCIKEADAMKYIAGVVCLNDTWVGGSHDEFLCLDERGQPDPVQRQGVDTLYKSADGGAAIGPWVVTVEELEDRHGQHLGGYLRKAYERVGNFAPFYCLHLRTSVNGQLMDESHTSCYLWGAEEMVACLSRFMTLPAGSVIGLGSAGWDGIRVGLGGGRNAVSEAVVELEDFGAMRTTFRRLSQEDARQSPLVAHRRRLGLPPVPSLEERPGPTFRVLRAAYVSADATEGVRAGMGMSPHILPTRALAVDDAPVVFPRHARAMHCSAQLAAIVGPEPVYNASLEQAEQSIRGIAPVLAVRDGSVVHRPEALTAWEQRGAHFIGCCGDGYYHLGPVARPEHVGAIDSITLILHIPGIGKKFYRAKNYRHGFADMIRMVSRTSTLLPGDVLSLGPAGPEMVLPPGNKPGRILLGTSTGVEMRIDIEDRRDSET